MVPDIMPTGDLKSWEALKVERDYKNLKEIKINSNLFAIRQWLDFL